MSAHGFAKVLAVALLLTDCRLAMSQVSVVGELSQDHESSPGESYSGTILVRNDSNEPQEAKVYQTDYDFHFDGSNTYGEPGSHPRSNAKWITFSPTFITLPPQGTMTVNFTVAVPAKNDSVPLRGTYWSMLMIEGIQKGSAESSIPQKDKKGQMGIMQTIRYGIQLATNIGGTGTKAIRFVGVNLVMTSEGKRTLQLDIENTGDLGMRPEVYAELFDPSGASVGKFSGAKYRMYPGTSVRQSIDLTSVTSGTYKALIVVDAGGDDVFGANYPLKF